MLELCFKANFEIAKSQARVYEDRDKKVAFWRAGNLVNLTSDRTWLAYHRNSHDTPYWQLAKVRTGEAPENRGTAPLRQEGNQIVAMTVASIKTLRSRENGRSANPKSKF